MILTQSHDGGASDTNHAGVSDANLEVASHTATADENNCFLRASGPQFLVLHATQTDNTLISLHNNCHRWSSKS